MDFYIHFNTFVEKNIGTTNSILNWEKKWKWLIPNGTCENLWYKGKGWE